MTKVFQGLPSGYDVRQVGCMRGFLSMFDFRHDRPSRRLLAKVSSAKYSSTSMILPHLAETCDSIVDTEENMKPIADVSKTSVKNIMEEEVSNENVSEVDLKIPVPKCQNNKLFLKLLQERNSLDQSPDSSPAFDSSEEKPGEFKSSKCCKCRHRNKFFHLRSKSLNMDCLSPRKIVVLKPRSVGLQNHEMDDDVRGISSWTHCKMNKEEQNDRNIRQFSLNIVKNKLRQAMGKQRQMKDSSPDMIIETSQNVQLEGSNIYIEAKRHLSEMLNNADANAESMTRERSLSLGRVLSFPEYSASPCSSPEKQSDGILETSIKNNGNLPFQDDSNHPIPIKALNEIPPFTEDYKVPQDSNLSPTVEVQGKTGIMPEDEEENTTVNSCSESSTDLINIHVKNEDVNMVDNGASPFQTSDDSSLDSFKDAETFPSPPVSPTLSPTSGKLGDSEHAIGQTDQSSPVSVLIPSFIDNEISPSSSISLPVEKSEASSSSSDEGVYAIYPLEDEESSFECIEAVLLASGLNWDNVLLRWISFYDILDPTLFDEVELLSIQPQHDHKLFFDCANEALQELCESYFRSFTGLSCGKQMFQAGTDLIHEVGERVKASLFQNPEVDSFNYLVERDKVGSGKWMNLEIDFELELMCSEMEEAIVDDLVEDSLICYAGEGMF